MVLIQQPTLIRERWAFFISAFRHLSVQTL